MKKNNMSLSEIMDTWIDGKKIRGIKTPPLATINELRYHMQALKVYGVTETINTTAKEIMEKCGYDIMRKGIGWEISLPKGEQK